jgi:hypothetical protein
MNQETPATPNRLASATAKIIGLVALSFVAALAISLIPAGEEPQMKTAGEMSTFLISSAGALAPATAPVTYFHDAFPDRGRAPDAEPAPSF